LESSSAKLALPSTDTPYPLQLPYNEAEMAESVDEFYVSLVISILREDPIS